MLTAARLFSPHQVNTYLTTFPPLGPPHSYHPAPRLALVAMPAFSTLTGAKFIPLTPCRDPPILSQLAAAVTREDLDDLNTKKQTKPQRQESQHHLFRNTQTKRIRILQHLKPTTSSRSFRHNINSSNLRSNASSTICDQPVRIHSAHSPHRHAHQVVGASPIRPLPRPGWASAIFNYATY